MAMGGDNGVLGVITSTLNISIVYTVGYTNEHITEAGRLIFNTLQIHGATFRPLIVHPLDTAPSAALAGTTSTWPQEKADRVNTSTTSGASASREFKYGYYLG